MLTVVILYSGTFAFYIEANSKIDIAVVLHCVLQEWHFYKAERIYLITSGFKTYSMYGN